MKKFDIYIGNKNGFYIGKIGENKRWWFDESFENSFEIFDLDGFYSHPYFRFDHVPEGVERNFVVSIYGLYLQITKSKLNSILEVGCASGWFTKKFYDLGWDVVAIEGSKAGVELTLKRGLPTDRVIHHDLRRRIDLGRKFDIVCCTEVAEHVEPPFSSILIETLTNHSDLIWFSYTGMGSHDAEYVHPNEQPEKFWINLFDFYGFGFIRIPFIIEESLQHRGTHVFFRREKYTSTKWDDAFALLTTVKNQSSILPRDEGFSC